MERQTPIIVVMMPEGVPPADRLDGTSAPLRMYVRYRWMGWPAFTVIVYAAAGMLYEGSSHRIACSSGTLRLARTGRIGAAANLTMWTKSRARSIVPERIFIHKAGSANGLNQRVRQ
jgi:hypothetical protein